MARPITLQTIGLPNFSGSNTAFAQGAAMLDTGLGSLAQAAGYLTPEQQAAQATELAKQQAYEAEALQSPLKAQAELLKAQADMTSADAALLKAQRTGLPKEVSALDAWELERKKEAYDKTKQAEADIAFGQTSAFGWLGGENIGGITDESYIPAFRRELIAEGVSPERTENIIKGYSDTIKKQSTLTAQGKLIADQELGNLQSMRDEQNALIKVEADNALRTLGVNTQYRAALDDTREVSLKEMQEMMQNENIDSDFFEDIVNTLHRQGYPASPSLLKMVMAESDHRTWLGGATEGRTEDIIKEIEAFGAKHGNDFKNYKRVMSFADAAVRRNNTSTARAAADFNELAAQYRAKGNVLTPDVAAKFTGEAMSKGGTVGSIAPELQAMFKSAGVTPVGAGEKRRMSVSGSMFTPFQQ